MRKLSGVLIWFAVVLTLSAKVLKMLCTWCEKQIPQSVRRLVPNVLTVVRLVTAPALVPMFLYGIWGGEVRFAWYAIWLYALVCLSDLVDGYLARRWHVESSFGKKWDPIADKLAVLPLLPALWLVDCLGPWLFAQAVVIGLREPAVDLLRRARTDTSFPSSPLAKWKTTIQMFSLGFLMGSHELLQPEVWWIGAILFTVAAVLSLVTGLDYFARAWQALDRLVGPMLIRWRVRSQL